MNHANFYFFLELQALIKIKQQRTKHTTTFRWERQKQATANTCTDTRKINRSPQKQNRAATTQDQILKEIRLLKNLSLYKFNSIEVIDYN